MRRAVWVRATRPAAHLQEAFRTEGSTYGAAAAADRPPAKRRRGLAALGKMDAMSRVQRHPGLSELLRVRSETDELMASHTAYPNVVTTDKG